jgi:hypothetical protein
MIGSVSAKPFGSQESVIARKWPTLKKDASTPDLA